MTPLTSKTPHHHKWWMSEVPSVLAIVFRCNCGATLTATETILAALNLKEARIEALEMELGDVLDVAIARGEKLDYMDDDCRERLAALRERPNAASQARDDTSLHEE